MKQIVEPYIIKGLRAVFLHDKIMLDIEEKIQKLKADKSAYFNDLIKIKGKLKDDMKDHKELKIELSDGSIYKLTKFGPDIAIEKLVINIVEK